MKHLFFFLALVIISTAASAQELPPPPPTTTYVDIDETYSTSGLQVQPKFPGGITEFQSYIAKSLKRIKAKGKMMVTFVIEKDGSVSDVRVVKGGNEKDAAKITKVLLASPKWSPGIQNEKPVRTRFALPLTFN